MTGAPIARRTAVALFVATLVASLACNGEHSGTEPLSCNGQIAVLAGDPTYDARTEPLMPIPGSLSKNCQGPSGNRYCYYLGPLPVFTLGNATVLDPYAGRRVLIVGKVVAQGSVSEIWPGTICRFD